MSGRRKVQWESSKALRSMGGHWEGALYQMHSLASQQFVIMSYESCECCRYYPVEIHDINRKVCTRNVAFKRTQDGHDRNGSCRAPCMQTWARFHYVWQICTLEDYELSMFSYFTSNRRLKFWADSAHAKDPKMAFPKILRFRNCFTSRSVSPLKGSS